ncbi:alkaline phosphatase family protein [Adhaeribacter radiodurans]|uniref:Alkaline phosphatase family protein n=1 Tax=Adhaeribacter radiodurans TaxID=2745197 RepID=A0A7L7L9Y1_9BACT|nr:alkaline phosphatase family protein [Adhaeribacter radiodurans]QMU29652.1 alkaline phosphatase family protein [Adhaeribacter radiodurans]
MSGKIIVGPILGFRGLKEGRWYTSALLVLRGEATPPKLTISINPTNQFEAEAFLLKTYADYFVWRLDWWIVQTDKEQKINYIVNNDQNYYYVVPAQNSNPRICYGSCFGVYNLKDLNKVRKKNALWKILHRVHQEKPYHLFFLGGDQIYSDQVWDAIKPLREWLSKSLKKRLQAPFTNDMQQQVEQFYFKLYLHMWGQKQPAAMLSQIPTLMMWDDHDIFDGWGSYTPEQQACAVFQGIYAQAREHFRLFQLQAKDNYDLGSAALFGKEGYTYAHHLGDLALVALDLRSERTQNQVMSPETWYQLQLWLNNLQNPSESTPCKHLLVMSGISIVNADLTLLEAAINLEPGQQRMEDDLKDQWLSLAHHEERLRLIQSLFQFSREAGCRVTIVSGDAHVAFTGYLESKSNSTTNEEANIINQLTSSAMVNLPPPTLVLYMMEKLLAGKTEKVNATITARLSYFPGTNRRLLGSRNWLSLTIDEQSSISAEWYVEGEIKPHAKVIPPFKS